MILTAQRLLQLSSNPKLSNYWYLVATVTLTVCNQPQEIPKIYHYALHLKDLRKQPSNSLFDEVESVVEKYQAIHSSGKDRLFSPYRQNRESISEALVLTNKFRESILKTSALSGLPKAINSLSLLRDTTPANLRTTEPNRPAITSYEDMQNELERGRKFWKAIYSKISARVINQMNSSYPDLWNYTLQHVYSPLLSYTGVLTPQETSLIVISCLIPQDVNPQLKGHLKGAKNLGVDAELIDEVRAMAIELSEWCGVEWKSEVAKL